MANNKKNFWSKIMWEDFTQHYRKMTAQQCFEDIQQSMDDLYNRNPDGNSFGAFMVRAAETRQESYPMARENGLKGGRPPSKVALPKNKQEVIEFAADNGLDVDDASTWAEQNLRERRGKDKDGKPIDNWKGALVNYCKAMSKRRSA